MERGRADSHGAMTATAVAGGSTTRQTAAASVPDQMPSELTRGASHGDDNSDSGDIATAAMVVRSFSTLDDDDMNVDDTDDVDSADDDAGGYSFGEDSYLDGGGDELSAVDAGEMRTQPGSSTEDAADDNKRTAHPCHQHAQTQIL